ncbi:MAG: 3-dehydroquinate synthase [Simkaniaceae bacterium]|nr:3-dehydroquinate synthase [Simkaniaceae bacterium]
MRETVTVTYAIPAPATEIRIGSGCLTEVWHDCIRERVPGPFRRIAVITDTRVAREYGDRYAHFFTMQGYDVTLHALPEGEKSKERLVKIALEDELFGAGHGRESVIIGVGGGVVLDIAGYVASTFCRGVRYLSVPTSLLAMVDASIGGKTGVNTPFGKNLVGTVYHPLVTFIDPDCLRTLSDAGIREGMIEVIKHGLIADLSLFRYIEKSGDVRKERDSAFLCELISRSCRIKGRIVRQDCMENGIRKILNFGHTIAHAVERSEEYAVSHGEAVAIGILTEGWINQRQGHIDQEEFGAIESLLERLEYRPTLSGRTTSENMMDAMLYDKKAKNGKTRFVMLDGIGKTVSFQGNYCTEVDEVLVREALQWMIDRFRVTPV